jgi:hypothetical protein
MNISVLFWERKQSIINKAILQLDTNNEMLRIEQITYFIDILLANNLSEKAYFILQKMVEEEVEKNPGVSFLPFNSFPVDNKLHFVLNLLKDKFKAAGLFSANSMMIFEMGYVFKPLFVNCLIDFACIDYVIKNQLDNQILPLIQTYNKTVLGSEFEFKKDGLWINNYLFSEVLECGFGADSSFFPAIQEVTGYSCQDLTESIMAIEASVKNKVLDLGYDPTPCSLKNLLRL